MRKIFFPVFVISVLISAQDRIKDINIFMGKWEMEENNINLYEEWQKKSDTTFYGISYSLEEGKKNITERLYILKLNDHIVYIAQPGNHSPTLFTLINSEDNKFVFENNEHDFPQRIIYHFISGNILNASIEGYENGTLKRKEFLFRKNY